MAFTKILNPATGKPFVEASPSDEVIELRRQILNQFKMKYDAAQTTSQNTNHWRMADSLSPDAANSLAVRSSVRSRSRYEFFNNGYLMGIGLTLTNDFVGNGPTIQVTEESMSDDAQRDIELRFSEYADAINLRQKLWQIRLAKLRDGEGFLVSMIDDELESECKIDYQVIECDQFSNPNIGYKNNDPLEVDGIRFNPRTGKPMSYFILDQHPGETEIFTLDISSGSWYPKEQVIHWFRKDRPWKRGVPETVSTLPLWALLRRYTLAVVQNAEIAADFTILLESLQPPNIIPFASTGSPSVPSESNPENWFDSFPIDRGLMTVLPNMYQMKQLDPKQPVTMYDTFVNALIQEACRPLLSPRNLSLGNSGGYNMASGTLDRQFYRQTINSEREDASAEVLKRVFRNWWFEAIRIPGYLSLSQEMTPSVRLKGPKISCRWDEVPEHTDPVKVAQAIDILHRGGHISDTDIQEMRFNRSVEDHYRNIEKQEAWRSENFDKDESGNEPDNSSSAEGESVGSLRNSYQWVTR